LVSGSAHVFVLLSVVIVIVTLPVLLIAKAGYIFFDAEAFVLFLFVRNLELMKNGGV